MYAGIQNRRFWTAVSPWALIGAVAILLPIFAFITVSNINRQKEKSIQLLREKGAALIRSFEAGTRTGMMGMNRGGFQLQRLLTETAQQPDIVYLFVVDVGGEILAHSDLDKVGVAYDGSVGLNDIALSKIMMWRQLTEPGGLKVFEIFQKFEPTGRPPRMRSGHMMMGRRMPPDQNSFGNRPISDSDKIIFIGLDMSPIEEAQREDVRHAILMGLILLLIGFAGITLLFLFQSYRTTKASLARIKAFSDNVVENMPIGLIALDDQRCIAAFNQTAQSVLKISYPEAIGKAAEDVLPPQLWLELKYQEIQDPVIEKEIDCQIEEGKTVPLEIGASLLKDENDTFLGYVILFKDLTEVRALRKEIERSRRLASVGRLAAGVAHEIRNPLSSIKGFAAYFKERYRQVPEDEQTATIMVQEVERLNRVVTQLLEFARPVRVKPRPTDLKALVEDSIKLIEKQASEKRIVIKTKSSIQVPETLVDPDRVNQILLNLYLNAIESMQGAGELKVNLSSIGETNSIEIKVSDTGCGINAENLSKIFDPYYTTKSSGTGLGLTIAHNIVEALGGTIKVQSTPGKGTTFALILPIKMMQR